MAVKPLAIKATAGIIGVGGAGIIGHQTYKALQNKQEETIKESNRDKLISQKYEILGTEQGKDVTWNEILNSYKEVIKKKADLAFEGFAGTESNTALATLKNKCEEALNSEETTLLNKARKWCIVPIKVEDSLKGRKILVVSKNEDVNDKGEWDKKVIAYTATSNKNKITNLNYEGAPITANVTVEHRNKFKDSCKALNEKKSYAGDYEETIDKAKEWCSTEQTGA